MLIISQVESEAEIAAVHELLREYMAWWAKENPEDFNAFPMFRAFDKEILPGVYAPPSGRLLLAVHDGRAAGSVSLKGVDNRVAELKRLYVRPAVRGHNIGQQLINKVMNEARQIGYRKVILDSHISMKQAHAIYESVGFKRVDAPADFPEKFRSTVVFMECNL